MEREWTQEEIQLLREKYPTTYPCDIKRVFGICKKVVVRKAKLLGIEKHPDYAVTPGHIKREHISYGLKTSTNQNFVRTQFKKGQPATEFSFKKGERPIDRIGPEREKQRILKSAESRKQTYCKEHARYLFGLPQKTRMVVHRQSRSKVLNRHYLKKKGYIIDEKRGIAYWTENTQRAFKTEKDHRFYKFMKYGTED